MSVTEVGTPQAPAVSTGTNAPSVSPTWDVTQARTVGNYLVCVVTNWGGTTGGIPGTPSGWAQALTVTGSSRSVVTYFVKVATGGDAAPTIAATNTGTATFSTLTAMLHELTGQDTVTPIAASGSATGTTVNPLVVATTGNVPQSGCFAFGASVLTLTGTVASTLGVSSGWTDVADNAAAVTRAHYIHSIQSNPTSLAALSESFSYTTTGAFLSGAILVIQPTGSMTVTATPDAAATGAAAKVYVVTNAAASGGTAGHTAGGPGTKSITPAQSNSVVLYADQDFFGNNAFTVATNNAIDEQFGASVGAHYAHGHYTGTVTGGSAITVGATSADGVTSGLTAIYELIPSGGTPAIDGSTQPGQSVNGHTALVSWPFVPPAGAVLAVVCESTSFPAAFTITDTLGLTWTRRDGGTDGTASIYTATLTSGSSALLTGGGGTLTATGLTPGTVVQQVAGAPTASGFQAFTKMHAATSVRLAYSTNSGMSSPSFVSAQTPDGSGYVRHTVSGLTAGTQYYYQAADTPSGGAEQLVGPIGRCKTLKAAGSPQNFTVALVSCIAQGDTTAPPALDAAMSDWNSYNADLNIFTGDFDYSGTTSTVLATQQAIYEAQIALYGQLGTMVSQNWGYYCRSDHEAGPDNGDSNNSYTATNIAAAQAVFPFGTLGDTVNTPVHGLYQAWVVGRVRFIMIDIRNTDRSPGGNTDNGSKTMLGATQLAWLESQLIQSEPLKVIISDVAWMGPASIVNGPDKWWSYDTERQALISYIAANSAQVKGLLLWHGDSHLVGCTPANNNAYGGFSVYCAAPMLNIGGGLNTSTFTQKYNNGGAGECRQYGRIAFTDDGAKITVDFKGWDAVNAVAQVEQIDVFFTNEVLTGGGGTLTAAGAILGGATLLGGSGNLSATEVLTNSAEGLSAGTTVTTGNSGGASGNAFDAVAIGGLATLVADNAQVGNGIMAYKVATGATVTTALAEWNASGGTNTSEFYRIECYIPPGELITAGWRPVAFRASGGHAASLLFQTNGTIQISIGTAFSSVVTFTTPAPIGVWFRVEGWITGDASAGAVSAALFLTLTARIPVELRTITALNTTGVLINYWYGQNNSSANSGPFWFDDIGASPLGYLGPVGDVPGITVRNYCEGQASGTVVTAVNSGNKFSGIGFDAVNIGALANLQFDTTHAFHGNTSYLVTTGSPAANAIAEWTISLFGPTSQSQAWFDVAVYLTSYSATQNRVVSFRAGTTYAGGPALTSTGKVVLLNATGGTVKTSTTTIPLNQWVRLAGYLIGDPAAGVLECKIFSSNADNLIPDETINATGLNTLSSVNRMDFGDPSSVASYAFWMDEPGASTQGYLPPPSFETLMTGGSGLLTTPSTQQVGATLTGGGGSLTTHAVEQSPATLTGGGGVLTTHATEQAGQTLTGGSGSLTDPSGQVAGATLTGGSGILTANAGGTISGAATLVGGSGTLTATGTVVTPSIAILTGGGGILTSLGVQRSGVTLTGGSGTLTAKEVAVSTVTLLGGSGLLLSPASQPVTAQLLGGSGVLTVTVVLNVVPAGANATVAVGGYNGSVGVTTYTVVVRTNALSGTVSPRRHVEG